MPADNEDDTIAIDPVIRDPHYLRQIALNSAMGITHPGNRTAKQIAEDAKVLFDFLNDGSLSASTN